MPRTEEVERKKSIRLQKITKLKKKISKAEVFGRKIQNGSVT